MKKITKLPLGLRDTFGLEAQRKEDLRLLLSKIFKQRNYTLIETPTLEKEDVFKTYALEHEKFYQLNSQESLVLRPDLTLPIARFLTTTKTKLPQKFAYIGQQFQKQKILSGQYDENTQAGVELIGYETKQAEYELLSLITLLNRRFCRQELILELGYAPLADIVLDILGSSGLQKERIKQFLYTKNLPAYQKEIAIYQKSPYIDFLKEWPWLFGCVTTLEKQIVAYQKLAFGKILMELLNYALELQKNSDQVVYLDLAARPPQKYYTGLIFTAYAPRRKKYIISGGRYDHLLTSFQETKVPAVGLGINLDELSQMVVATKNKVPLLYARKEEFFLAQALIDQKGGYELCLADSYQEALTLAEKRQVKLFTYQEVAK